MLKIDGRKVQTKILSKLKSNIKKFNSKIDQIENKIN